jgi:hypothetical protein
VLPWLQISMDYGGFCCFAFIRVVKSFVRQYLCNHKYSICDIWHVVITITVRMCGNIVSPRRLMNNFHWKAHMFAGYDDVPALLWLPRSHTAVAAV